MKRMKVTIQLPEDISAALEVQWDNVQRRSLEAIAIDRYRTGGLTEAQVDVPCFDRTTRDTSFYVDDALVRAISQRWLVEP